MAQITVPNHLFKSLHLSNPQSYNIYLVGSRLWGTNTDASDWDLLIVGDVSSTQLTSLHKAQYDIKVLDRQEFMQHINDGSIIETLCALMRKEDMLQYAFDIGQPTIDPATMKTWMETRRAKDLDKAEKFWLKGNRQAAWKILRHILHAKVLYDYLVIALREKRVPLTIDDIQTIVRPASLLCDKSWMQLDWSDVRAATMDALVQL
ncbi:unnamed protein product [Adineta ricciae]|uniref:Polymerase nucleotidyl transferase domain-containing protein n=1 Tax=Adineta ricciae TaxID=249248 RepID=A0A814MC54_ADIRI|nr:unnamed protein product [Adineta ricciae]CAF1430429.1 unnamed protein product [Adineta ricciae]